LVQAFETTPAPYSRQIHFYPVARCRFSVLCGQLRRMPSIQDCATTRQKDGWCLGASSNGVNGCGVVPAGCALTSTLPQAPDLQELDALIQRHIWPVVANVDILLKEMRGDRSSLGEVLTRIENGLLERHFDISAEPATKVSPCHSRKSSRVDDHLQRTHSEMHVDNDLEGRMAAHLDSSTMNTERTLSQASHHSCHTPDASPKTCIQFEQSPAQQSGVEEAQSEHVVVDEISTADSTNLKFAGEDKDANPGSKEAVEEHHHDENAHHRIHLKEESSLASVFTHDGDVERPPYDVAEFYYNTGCCQAVARSEHFQNLTVFTVVLNALFIGIDADWNRAENIFDAEWFFIIAANSFCVYFTGELLIRFIAFEQKLKAFKDGWFKFDTFLVVTMILDTWIIMVAMKLQTGDGKFAIPVQPLRMLRLFKLTRMARLMKAFPELVTMIKGLLRSLRAISSSGILVGLMVYTWAILLHMLLKNEEELNKKLYDESLMNFETITNCMWILIMNGTLMLDGATFVMTELLFSHKMNFVLAGIAFSLYLLLSALLILQMLIGVLCDVCTRVSQEQRDAAAIGIIKQELLDMLQSFNGGDGRVAHNELMTVMKHPRAVAVMKHLNINRVFLMELQKMMYVKEDSTVPIKQVLELMIMCRGDNSATVEALAGGFCFIEGVMLEIKDQLKEHHQEQTASTHDVLASHVSLLEAHILETRSRLNSFGG